ncbi:hypothetical protein [uncultured Amphritea sp.]|uniref:hypothetical protein n=1 Tax=uncultured Amphritea sp. TaxID=981605 RepID=UPI0026383698|nr:hypothetical protein [uncultured Amphritea sp.]
MSSHQEQRNINAMQSGMKRTERALTEARAVIMAALDDLKAGGTIAAKAKLENYVKEVMCGD